jgi:5-methylcytosine-specific restriction endonuclease McrA
MDKFKISNWARQTKYRAKKYGSHNNLDVEALLELINSNRDCKYCGKPMRHLDHIFPLKDGGPNVEANVVPICSKCKNKKGNNNIIKMLMNGHITPERYKEILAKALAVDGDETLRNYIKEITGYSVED